MNEPHDPNQTTDILAVAADSLPAGDPLATTDHRPAPPTPDGPAGDLPVVPGYRVLREIARGGMGRVLAAHDLTLDREIALKILRPGADADRFVRESKITARLPHPGIPPVHALGRLADGSPFLAMKLIAGQTLNAELKTADRPRLLQAFTQVCQAVGYAHSRGVIHRDLKPANVMVGAFGEVQVMDWGLARTEHIADPTVAAPEEFASPQPSQTQAGTVLGTPEYMAPEQARGEAADARADVFALGGILCKILTGQPPFGGESAREVIRRAGAADLAEASARLDGCGADAEVVALCRRCLSPSPADRPADGQAVADGLTAYLNGVQERLQAAQREHAVMAEQRKRWKVQRMLAAAVVGLATAAVFGVALASLWQQAERAKVVAVSAQGEAETARQVTEKARAGEAEARKAVERERAKLAVFEYGRSMEVAHQEYREHNASAAVALLDRTDPGFRGWEYRYVHRLCHFDLLTLRGHTSNVTAAAYSPDGSRIVTTSYDSTAKVWDGSTGAVVLTFTGHRGMVWSAAFSPDGSRVVTAGDDSVKVWDAKTGAEFLTIKPRGGVLLSAAFSPDGSRIVTGSYKTVQVWNARTGAEVRTLEGHNAAVKSVSFSANGSWIVSASEDKTARVWDAVTGGEILVFKQHTAGVSSASFSPDMSRVVTASWDGTAKVWDRRSGAESLTLRGPGFNSASFSADGSRIVTASGNAAKVWDANTGAEIVTLEGHFHSISSVSFHPDGSKVLTGSMDYTAKVWDAKTSAEFLSFKGQTAGEVSASFSRDGSRVITASGDRTAKIWDATSGTQLLTLKGNADRLRSAWFSPDGSRVVTGCYDGKVKIWDARKGVPILTFKGRSDGYVSPFSPDGSRVVTTGWERKEFKDARSGTHGFIETTDNTARVWDTRTGIEVLTLRGHSGAFTSASFRGDGLRIVTTSMDRTAKVWDAGTGAELLTLRRAAGQISSASFNLRGTQIVTAGDNTATIWDATTGAEVVSLRGHTGWVFSATFSPDGSRIVTASSDGTVKLWDATTGAEVLSLKTGGTVASTASFSADGSRIVTLGNGIKIWDHSPINRKLLSSKAIPRAGTARGPGRSLLTIPRFSKKSCEEGNPVPPYQGHRQPLAVSRRAATG
jgi:WD40 repeat protein